MSHPERDILLKHFRKDSIEDRNGVTVLSPENPDDAVRAVNVARDHGLKLCPAGSMSHLSVTDEEERCIVLSACKMNRLIAYSAGDLFITVGGGLRFGYLKSLVTDEHLAFVFADWGYTGTVGGAVSLGLSARADFERVHIKRWVISLSFVTPYGKHLRVGSVTLKSVAGYDITKLLVGSKGRLGFITSVTLRLVQKASLYELRRMILEELPVFSPVWDNDSLKCSPVERNLKNNLDPDGVFPSL